MDLETVLYTCWWHLISFQVPQTGITDVSSGAFLDLHINFLARWDALKKNRDFDLVFHLLCELFDSVLKTSLVTA